MTKAISVILPVYNAGEHLLEAIESILTQSFKNFELIIINDGSIDNPENIIKSLSDTRIRYLVNDGNKGLIYTLNKGIEEAQHDYIVRMDADDIAMPNRLSLQYDFMEKNPDIGACGCYASYIGNKTGNWQYPVTDKEIRCRLMWGSSIIHPTAIIRKDVLIKNNIRFNEDYIAAEDYKFWVDLAKVSNLHNIPEMLLKYRIHKNQITSRKISMMNQTKSKIIYENIAASGVKLSGKDFDILSKFVLYVYEFTIQELNRLFEIYFQFIEKNKVLLLCDSILINNQIKERLFEACYFSTRVIGIRALKIYKKHYKLKNISKFKVLKFYYKGILYK